MIDSAGLGELVVLYVWAQAKGNSIKLAAPGKRIRELLELTNLASVFPIHSTLDEALFSWSNRQVA
jgi:anti-anti-sigma factor